MRAPEYLSVQIISWTSFTQTYPQASLDAGSPFFLSFFLSLHFHAVYFGQLVARSHSAAVPMVIAAEIATGGWGGGLDGERERQRRSVRKR